MYSPVFVPKARALTYICHPSCTVFIFAPDALAMSLSLKQLLDLILSLNILGLQCYWFEDPNVGLRRMDLALFDSLP